MQIKGWAKHKQPRKADNTKYTGKEFCRELNKDIFAVGKKIVANIGGGHMVCIKESGSTFKVCDTWDSTDGCCPLLVTLDKR